jgi:hypothetical protein
MSKPRHGTLRFVSDKWYFFPGKSTEGILLPDLQANCQSLIDSGQLFRGHTKFKNVYDARSQLSLCASVLRHVSAHGLKNLLAPTSLKSHQSIDPDDKYGMRPMMKNMMAWNHFPPRKLLLRINADNCVKGNEHYLPWPSLQSNMMPIINPKEQSIALWF